MSPAIGQEFDVIGDDVRAGTAIIAGLPGAAALSIELPSHLAPGGLRAVGQALNEQQTVLCVPSKCKAAVVGHIAIEVIAKGFGRFRDENISSYRGLDRRSNADALPDRS